MFVPKTQLLRTFPLMYHIQLDALSVFSLKLSLLNSFLYYLCMTVPLLPQIGNNLRVQCIDLNIILYIRMWLGNMSEDIFGCKIGIYLIHVNHVAGLFCLAKLSFFSFSKLQKQKLNAQSRSIKMCVVYFVHVKMKIKWMKSDFPLRKENLAALNKPTIR